MAKSYDDIDLMQYFDGELDEATAGQVEAVLTAGDADDEAILASLGQMRDLVRGHLELAADDAEPALDAMWDRIERRIQANGVPKAAGADGAIEAVERERRPARRRGGAWKRLMRWFDGHRSHFMTGALTAGAVAALFLWLRPTPATAPSDRVANVPTPGTIVPVNSIPVEPRVESLEVPEGSATVFQIEAEEGDEHGATVILVTFDEDDVEGPI